MPFSTTISLTYKGQEKSYLKQENSFAKQENSIW
jgi:hypothetical protein